MTGDLQALDDAPEEEPAAARIEAAIAALPDLAREARHESPAKVRAVLVALVARATVIFSHRPEGKRRTFVECIEIDPTEDLLALLGLPKRSLTCQLSQQVRPR